MIENRATAGEPTGATASGAALELVVAVSENDVIGRDNRLPWRLPADLRRFKRLTVGKPILMGRKTFESIGRALPGRHNLVLTRRSDFAALECTVVRTLAAARSAAGAQAALMVIGGADVYRLCLPLAARIHLTLVHTQVAGGDAFFHEWRGSEWIAAEREWHAADEANEFAFSYITLQHAVRGRGT